MTARGARPGGRRRPRTVVLVVLVLAALAAAALLGLWGRSLSTKLERERALSERHAHAVAVLSQDEVRRVRLVGRDGTLVVSTTGAAALVVRGLPQAPRGREYQVWVTEDGAAEADVTFRGGEPVTVVGLAQPVPLGARVSVTLEPVGGALVLRRPSLFGTRA